MTDHTDADEDRRQRSVPQTLRLQSISAGLTVNDLEASVKWYCDFVGFYLRERFEHGAGGRTC